MYSNSDLCMSTFVVFCFQSVQCIKSCTVTSQIDFDAEVLEQIWLWAIHKFNSSVVKLSRSNSRNVMNSPSFIALSDTCLWNISWRNLVVFTHMIQLIRNPPFVGTGSTICVRASRNHLLLFYFLMICSQWVLSIHAAKKNYHSYSTISDIIPNICVFPRLGNSVIL